MPPLMPYAHWVQTFLEARAAEMGAAQNTLNAYGRDLKDFTGWLARTGRSAEPSNRQ